MFRHSAVAALAFAAVMAGEARAQIPAIDRPILVNPASAHQRDDISLPFGTQPGTCKTVKWVGHSLGTPNSGAPWFIGSGFDPLSSLHALWTWNDFSPGENDSLQGWWPIRLADEYAGGLSVPDYSRPSWALDYGNQANYVLNSRHQNRTFGVVGIWHADGGSTVSSGIPGADPTWTPISGTASAWCGLRAGRDVSYTDPITGNPFNQSVLEYNGTNAVFGGTSKHFPGYGSQWDQLLYRDVRVANGASLSVSFEYATRMSRGAALNPATRVGWFDKDPTLAPTSNPDGNFISSSLAAGNAPVDSFMVYVGVPANPTDCQHAD